MMLRRIRRTQAVAKEQLDARHDQHRGIEEVLIGVFSKVLEPAQDQEHDAAFGARGGNIGSQAARCFGGRQQAPSRTTA